MKKKIEIQSFLDFKFVSHPTFSPDGKKVAYVVQQACLEENTYKGDLYLLDVDTKTSIQLTSHGDAKGYTWTPQGTLLFAAKRTKEDSENEGTVYYEINPQGGEAARAFALPVQATRLEIVDEDTYILAATQNNGEPLKDRAYEIIEESPFWFNGRGFTQGLRGRLYVYHRGSGELTPITEPFFDAGSFEVKDRQVLYRGAQWEKGLKYEYPGIYLYDLDSGSTECLAEPNQLRGYVFDFWTEGKIMVATKEGGNPGMDYDDFYVMDIKTKKLTKLADYDHSIGSGSVGSDARLGGGRGKKRQGDYWFFVTTVNDGSYLRSINMEDGTISDTLTPDGSLDSFDVNSEHMVTCGLYGNKLAELYLDGEQVTHFNDWFEQEYEVITPEFHSYTGSDGVEIHGWAMKPAGYEEAKKANPDQTFPCILHIHGGPRTVFGSVFHHEMQMWANAGFYVIFCNPRGSDGRGGEFADICNKYGTVDYTNIMEFTDEMLKKYPDIDPKRLGETGGSYGGFMTNWIIGHTDRFAAACSQRSIANWTVFEHTSDIGYSFTKNHQGARTRENMEQLWEHSPLKYADKCTTPTLFIHSDQDYRCWMAEGLSMFTALKMHGCESRLVLFHGENHELSRSGRPKNRIRRMEEIVNWMQQHLMQ